MSSPSKNNNEKSCPFRLSSYNFLSNVTAATIHPGHLCAAVSLPCLFFFYRGMRVSVDDTVVRKAGHTSLESIADEQVRRAIAKSLASRALKTASFGCVGVLGLFFAGAFYVSGVQSMGEAISRTTHWATNYRIELDKYFGVKNRVDERHPSMVSSNGMTEEELMEVAAISDKDWEADMAESAKK
jgi:hypothetical protein